MTDGLIGAASAAERTLCWSIVVKRYRDLSASFSETGGDLLLLYVKRSQLKGSPEQHAAFLWSNVLSK